MIQDQHLIETCAASKSVFEGKILHVFVDDINLPNGERGFREYIKHIGAVAVLPLTEDGKVICVRQYRYAVGQVTVEIPAGKLDAPDEDPAKAALRELREETGALEFDIAPVCVYSVTGKNRVNQTGDETFGMLYVADIYAFESELHSEMESVTLFEELPIEWTYPLIQPLLTS